MEKIIFHDNNITPQYGPDDRLLNNWNPDLDYGREYAIVHIRMQTPAFIRSRCALEPEDRKAFYAEAARIFEDLGWHILRDESVGQCMEVAKDHSRLTIHPVDFGGLLLKNEVKTITEALAKAELFRPDWVDIYETVYDWSDEEYAKLLEERLDMTRREVLKSFRTKFRVSYCRRIEAAKHISKSIAPGLRLKNTVNGFISLDQQAVNFVDAVIDDLIEKGYLLQKEAVPGSGTFLYVRTLNREEQKKNAKSLAYGDIFCG